MRKVLAAIIITGAIISFLAVFVFVFLVNTAPLSKFEFLETFVRFKAFRYGLSSLDENQTKTLYQWSCVGRCHGAGPIETSKHTSREWRTIIERMRVKNGADVNVREEEAIASYLQKHYGSNVPTILSPEVNNYLKRYLWKSDFGESDLYVDIIYSPVAYFELMGETSEMRRFEADKNLVFRVYLNTHQGKLEPWPIKDLAVLKGKNGEQEMPLDWQVLYESGDLHHLEGVLRFKRPADIDEDFMEMVIRDLPGQKERVFRWDMPIPDVNVKAKAEGRL